MTFPWTPLSEPFDPDAGPYDAIIVGSGYGGGVAACRLAEAGWRVLVLERGREIAPGAYPRDGATAAAQFQTHLSAYEDALGPKDGLYDLRIGPGMATLVGCGLGGTSLINAGVVEPPLDAVLDALPGPLSAAALEDGFAKARKMLGAQAYPEGRSVPKLDALERAAKGLGAPMRRPDIAVTFEDGVNAAGLWQAACTDCGDCVSGCNYGAKNTVLMTYLVAASAAGARLVTGADVSHLARDGDGWRVFFEDDSGARSVAGPEVILAAGTLGSSAILMRSQSLDGADLTFSNRLGQGVSGNGDIWAFGYDAALPDDAAVHAVGAGPTVLEAGPAAPGEAPWRPGPTITGLIDLRQDRPVGDGVVLEDGAMPGALAAGYAMAFPAMAATSGSPFRFGDAGRRLTGAAKHAEALARDPLHAAETVRAGPVSRTLPFLGMAHDAAAGEIVLGADGQAVLAWADGGADPAIARCNADAKRAADAIKAEFLANPLWQDEMGRRALTVHPLGGCGMGEDAATGVVDPQGRVFDPARPGALHGGLHVMDGSILPGPVGINPLLTIAGLAERSVALLIADRGVRTPEPPRDRVAPDVPDPQDVLAALRAAEAGLHQVRAAIAGRAWELAKMIVTGMLRFVPGLSGREDQTADLLFKDARAATIVDPVAVLLLDLLRPIRDALEAGDLSRALAAVEHAVGDVSPEATLDETMRGFLAPVADGDPVPDDPFAVAETAQTAATMTARMTAESVLGLVGTPHTAALSGTLSAEALGEMAFAGTFTFLAPDPARIETWEMIYDAALTPEGADAPTHRMCGHKRLARGRGAAWFRDLTQLDVEIRAVGAENVVARGRLEVSLEEAIRQAAALTVAYGARLTEQAKKAKTQLISCLTRDPEGLPALLNDVGFRAMAGAAVLVERSKTQPQVLEDLAGVYRARLFARMGDLVLRTNGGLMSYMADRPAQAIPDPDAGPVIDPALPEAEVYWPTVGPDLHVRLTRYPAPEGAAGLPPVIVAGGFGTRAASFAAHISGTSFAGALHAAGRDVWLFDYRGCGGLPAGLVPFDLDDVAGTDWPRAIDLVLARTGAEAVDVVGHCIGGMTATMAALSGEGRMRRLVISQLGAHAITSWSNHAKADARVAEWLATGLPEGLAALARGMGMPPDLEAALRDGLAVLEPRSGMGGASPSGLSEDADRFIDAALYGAPGLPPVACHSPTCRRIDLMFGPSYHHDALDDATHTAIRTMFAPVASAPFAHIARIFERGQAVAADGSDAYLPHRDRLRMPVLLLAGARNREMLPEATLRTQAWLEERGPDRPGGEAPTVERVVHQAFGHMDTFIGRDAADLVFPGIVAFLARD